MTQAWRSRTHLERVLDVLERDEAISADEVRSRARMDTAMTYRMLAAAVARGEVERIEIRRHRQGRRRSVYRLVVRNRQVA